MTEVPAFAVQLEKPAAPGDGTGGVTGGSVFFGMKITSSSGSLGGAWKTIHVATMMKSIR